MSLNAHNPKKLDLKEWMVQNDMESLYSKFATAGLTLQDIESNTEESLRRLFDYIGCNPIDEIKLFTAIRLLPDAILNHPAKEAIPLTKAEQNIMEKMNRKSAKLSKCIRQTQEAINNFGMKCQKDIHRICDKMISQVEEYRKMLLVQLGNMRDTKKKKLESYLIKLQRFNESVTDAQITLKKISTSSDKDKYDQMWAIVNEIESIETEEKIKMKLSKLEPEIYETADLLKHGVEERVFIKYRDEKLNNDVHFGISWGYYHPQMLKLEDKMKKPTFLPIQFIHDQQQLLFDGFMRSKIFQHLSQESSQMSAQDVVALCNTYYTLNIVALLGKNSERKKTSDLMHELEILSDEMRVRKENFMAYQILKMLAKSEQKKESRDGECYSYILAKFLRDLGSYEESEKYFLKCVQIDDSRYNHSYGYLLYLMGDYDKALKYIKIQLGVRFMRSSANVHLYHALVKKMLGNHSGADESLSKALQAIKDKGKMLAQIQAMMEATKLNRDYLEKFQMMVTQDL